MATAIHAIQPLTQLQRERARDNARKALLRKVGDAPNAEHYIRQQVSKYPLALQLFVAFLCLVVLIAAFVPSSIRLYDAAHDALSVSIQNAYAVTAAAIATIFLAEIGQIVFSLALAMFNEKPLQRRFLIAGAVLATIIAFAGNVSVAKPAYEFAVLEAIAPPFMVLATAYVLKEQLLHVVEQRHAGKVAYEHALQAWQDATRNIDEHQDWQRAYANALMDAIRSVRRKDTETLSHREMLMLVQRELRADDIMLALQDVQQPVDVQPQAARAIPANNNGKQTDEVRTALQDADDAGPVRVECPHCDWSKTYKSKRSARFALTAHLRKHPEKQTAVHVNGHVKAVAV